MRSKTLGIIASTLAAIALLASLASAQNIIDDKWWSTYHKDELRDGLSPLPWEDGSNIGMIWTWPRTDVVPLNPANSLVDIPSGIEGTDWTLTGAWHDPSELIAGLPMDQLPDNFLPADYYGTSISGNGYKWATVVRAGLPKNRAIATWILPANFNTSSVVGGPQDGYFRVQAWFPSSGGGKTNSPAARYTIQSLDGSVTVAVNQKSGGGWVDLGTGPYHLGPGNKITLSNELDQGTYDAMLSEDANKPDSEKILPKTIVCADAIRVLGSTGVEIYSSPVAGTLNIPDGTGGLKKTAVTWFGDIESSMASLAPGIKDFGAIYCVRSDFQDTTPDPEDTGRFIQGTPEMAVGTARWRYPAGGKYDEDAAGVKRRPIDRDPIEGPIGRIGDTGGVLGPPTLVEISTGAATSVLGLVVGGMDGQVYCINAETGKLIWKGPGVTISEPAKSPVVVTDPSLPSDWSVQDNNGVGRYDAFGGTFAYIEATTDYSKDKSIIYKVGPDQTTDPDSSDPNRDARETTTQGHMYAIYAWMPAQISGDPNRIRDAYYGITYGNKSEPEWVRVDQRAAGDPDAKNVTLPDDPHSGKWVRIGGSYWNVSKVELSTQTRMENPDGRVVVADAIMVVPDTVGAFSYSAPIWDGRTSSALSKVYVGNSNGRVYAFRTNPSDDYLKKNATELYWTFPKVQNRNPASDPIHATASSWGSIVSSPVYINDKDKLIVSAMDGTVRCLTDLDKDEDGIVLNWTYDSAEQVDASSGKVTGSLGDPEPFSSSPAVYGEVVYVPSTGGRLHALHLAKETDSNGVAQSQRIWMYPDRAASAVPLAAFRFSTPAIVKLPGDSSQRIYVGCTGGPVYGFRDEGTSGRLLSDDPADTAHGFEFKNPSPAGPIQGSIAIDGGDTGIDKAYDGNIYVGTMGATTGGDDGGFYWMNRRDGFASSNGFNLWAYTGYTSLGSVFSSPAVANQYIYVGVGKGRLCAFSASAFGGGDAGWVGGGRSEAGRPPFPRVRPADILSAQAPEIDLFAAPVYKATSEVLQKNVADGHVNIKDIVAAAGAASANFLFDSTFDGQKPWEGHKRAFSYGLGLTATNPRQIYYEWGEDMYVIAWNLPPLELQHLTWGNDPTPINNIHHIDPIAGGAYEGKGVASGAQRGAVSFRFIDNSPGYGSGGTLNPRHPDAIFQYQCKWKNPDGKVVDVWRSVAIAKVDIRADGTNPPAPGVGWDISVAVAVQPVANENQGRQEIASVTVPLLINSPGTWKIKGQEKWDTGTTGTTALRDIRIPHQPVGVNCPLAIIDEGLSPGPMGTVRRTPTDLAWPDPWTFGSASGGYKPNRTDVQAHFNGNGYVTDPNAETVEQKWAETTPVVYLGFAGHGTNSTPGNFGLADRSATGLRISSVTVDPNDSKKIIPIRTDSIKTLRFQMGDFHWRGGNGAVVGIMPWDYPPYFNAPGYNWTSRLERDYPDIYRNQATFQMSPDNNDPTTEKVTLQPAVPKDSTLTYVDYDNSILRANPGEGWVEVPKFQPANSSQPGYSTSVLAYLDSNNNGRFDGGEITVDRPQARVETYRKFQISLDVPPDYHMVVEKPLTIDITGEDRAAAPHGLGVSVLSDTLTPWYDKWTKSLSTWYKDFTVRNEGNVNLRNVNILKLDMFADNVNPAFPLTGNMMTTPNPAGSFGLKDINTGIVSSFDGWDPKWGVVGTEPFATVTDGYGFTLSKSRVGEADGLVLTIPDTRKVEDNWQGSRDAMKMLRGNDADPILPSISVRVPLSQPTGSYHQVVPLFANNDSNVRTDPSFTLNVSVAEDRLTGGTTPGSATQTPGTPGSSNPNVPPAAWGNTQPTAVRDPGNGNIYTFWSTNSFLPVAQLEDANYNRANSPWFIMHGTLPYNAAKGPGRYDWQFGIEPTDTDAPIWWKTPLTGDADYPFPKFSNAAKVNWPDPVPDGAIADSVRYSSPFAALVEGSSSIWLFAQAQIDRLDPNSKKIERQSRIVYTPATGGRVSNDAALIYSFVRDPLSAKMNPKASVWQTCGGNNPCLTNMLLTWHGGDAGRWGIYSSFNQSPDTHNPNGWSADLRLSTPSCLVSAAEPVPVHRNFRDVGDGFYDIAYTGAWKFDQSTDIIMTRYQMTGSPSDPKMTAIKLPRVLNEEVLRDSKRNIYLTEHLSIVRPPAKGAIDDWGNPGSSNPFIHVALPNGTVISATDGGKNGTGSAAVASAYDRASGVNTYSYAVGSDAEKYLGQTLVDYSAGIIRFTKPLPAQTRVFADYTPQSQRLTRGLEQDSAPFMFIENSSASNPGILPVTDDGGDGSMPVGRRWLFWRKPATSGVQSSTIYYKTYRVAAPVMVKGLPAALKVGPQGRPLYTVSGGSGKDLDFPIEISPDGKTIYFPAYMERYPGQPGYPGPVTIVLRPEGANTEEQDTTLTFDTLTWQEELAETALPTRQRVNEGQVSAFADPNVSPTRVWVFWSSTRAGKTDIYYQTISPNFRPIF